MDGNSVSCKGGDVKTVNPGVGGDEDSNRRGAIYGSRLFYG